MTDNLIPIFKQELPTPPVDVIHGKNTCEFIILHHTGTPKGTIKGVINGLYRNKDYRSSHFTIDYSGEIYKFGKTTDIFMHTGVSSWGKYGGSYGLNPYSIGIELVGPTDPEGFSKEQLTSLKKLVKWLCTSYGLNFERILRHKDITQNDIKRRNKQILWNITQLSRKIDPDNRLHYGQTFNEFRIDLLK